MEWVPKRSLAEVDSILCAPGGLHELQTSVVDDQLQRVYKNLWPSLRAFWLWVFQQYPDNTYAVFEQQRVTFRDMHDRAVRAASVYRTEYHIIKGDRVAICSRNYPDYLVAFWACHLIGAVSVLVNAWSPLDVLHHCITHTGCKLLVVDPERADRLESSIGKLLASTGATDCLVLQSHEGKGKWQGMRDWNSVMRQYSGEMLQPSEEDPVILPEDNSAIVFTSGTTGRPKGVLSTQRMFLTNVPNILVASFRAILRRGEDIPGPPTTPSAQKGVLVPVPLFHVNGLTSLVMLSSFAGMKIVFMRKWDAEEAAKLVKAENISLTGGVPSMVSDIVDSSLKGYPLESLAFGGAPAPEFLPKRVMEAFPNTLMSQGYGLTESNGTSTSAAGEDYLSRLLSCGKATPINDIAIISGNIAVAPGVVGEIWLRGPNIMKGYWNDKDATDQVLTQDGWFKTGDLGYLDKDGFLYIRDRIKDIIIRGGENIDSVSVENALYADQRVTEAAVVGVPHKRLGELVTALVYVKPEHRDHVTEVSLIDTARKSLPRYAVPAMIIIQYEPFGRTPSGKIVKADLRQVARRAWAQREAGEASKL